MGLVNKWIEPGSNSGKIKKATSLTS